MQLTTEQINQHMIIMLRAYQVFARAMTGGAYAVGTHNPYFFSAATGLCRAVADYTDVVVGVTTDDLNEDQFIQMNADLSTALKSAITRITGDEPAFPFGGEPEYFKRIRERNQHENPARLEFVKQYLQELESAV